MCAAQASKGKVVHIVRYLVFRRAFPAIFAKLCLIFIVFIPGGKNDWLVNVIETTNLFIRWSRSSQKKLASGPMGVSNFQAYPSKLKDCLYRYTIRDRPRSH